MHKTIFTREITEQRKKDLWKGAQQIVGKNTYDNPAELLAVIQSGILKINKNSKTAAAITLIARQAMLQGFLQYGDYYRIKSQIKPKKAHSDIHIPTNEEVRDSVVKLEEHHRLAYRLLLYSGIRVSEAQYLLDNKGKLKVQQHDGFVKITLDWSRGSKNALYAYMPIELYQNLGKAQQDFAGLQARIKKLKLVPLKYCRKWFAQKCLEADIKPEIINFYQGRAPRTVLLNHYVNLQVFADADYGKVMARIREVLM